MAGRKRPARPSVCSSLPYFALPRSSMKRLALCSDDAELAGVVDDSGRLHAGGLQRRHHAGGHGVEGFVEP